MDVKEAQAVMQAYVDANNGTILAEAYGAVLTRLERLEAVAEAARLLADLDGDPMKPFNMLDEALAALDATEVPNG